MSTPPDLNEVTAVLTQLNRYAELLLQCDEGDMEEFSRLLNEREPLVAELNRWTLEQFDPQAQSVIIPLYKKLLETDEAVDNRLDKLVDGQGKDIRKLHTTRHAIGQYKFPIIGDRNRIENEG